MLYDSSVLIDYLDGDAETVTFVDDHFEERATTPPTVWFEVYQGEVFKSGGADFDAVDTALSWVTVVNETEEFARAAAELQDHLQRNGDTLAARDALIAGTAKGLDEHLVVADADFDVDGIDDVLEITFL